MQIYNIPIDSSPSYNFSPYHPSDIVYFDIETTGFSPEISSVYLIGCCYYEDHTWHIIQWFADDYQSELSLLESFYDFIGNYKVILHYNGSGFDIPYITKKFRSYHLDYDFSHLISLDLYKKILPIKKLLNLPNLKQKSIEKFLNLHREDSYDGRELIEVYINYMKMKFKQDPSLKKLISKLLLHNKEDLLGLLATSAMITYSDLWEGKFSITQIQQQENRFSILLIFENPFPLSFSLNTEHFCLVGQNHIITLDILCFIGELKYFFDNYKDYFYLPQEDTAIHKSLAIYVDKTHRRKAKASDCYSKKTGIFIPQFNKTISPFFKIEYQDSISFVETQDFLPLPNESLYRYTNDILRYIKKELLSSFVFTK